MKDKLNFYNCKIFRVGKGSLAVTLPKDVMLSEGLDVGTVIDVIVVRRK